MRFFHSLHWLWLLTLLTAGEGLGAQTTVTLGGARRVLEDVTPDVEVQFRAMRFNRAQNVWNVEAFLTNRSIREVRGPFVLIIENFSGTTGPLQVDGQDENIPARPFFDFSSTVSDLMLSPGERSSERTLSFARGTGSPQVVAKVFAAADQFAVAVAFVRTLDSAGQPLGGVLIEQSGTETNTYLSDPSLGVASIGAAGQNIWKFSRPGFLPAWRAQLILPGGVSVVPSPRLTRRTTNATIVTVLQGGRLQTPGIDLQVPPGVVELDTGATLTPLDSQSLPVFLPLGWSPLQAFWLESDRSFSASVTLTPWGAVRGDDGIVLAKLDEVNSRWVALQLLTGSGTNAIIAQLNSAGAYVIAVADRPPTTPPAPQLGNPLPPVPFSLPVPANLTAFGIVTPSVTSASRVPERVTSLAEVSITNSAGAMPSGLVLQSNIREQYRLVNGALRHPPRYESFIVAYQHPGDALASTLHAHFPLRPMILLGPDELDGATVTVDVLDSARFDGAVLTEGGGSVASGRIRINAAAGDVSGTQAIQLRTLNPEDFLELAPSNVIEAAFELAVSGITAGRRLSIQLDSPAASAHFVIARIIYESGQYGLEPLERLATDAAGVLTSAEPISGERLDGVIGPGQYLIIRTPAPQQLVLGTARNSLGQPASGMPIRIEGQPWLTISGLSGAYKLIATAGNTTVFAVDLAAGDSARTTALVGAPLTTINVATGATGPSAFLLSPTNSVNVSRIAEIQVAFSEPINAGTLTTNAVQLLTTNGPVPATVVLNLRNTIVTILPNEPLFGSTLHTVNLSTNIADLTGLTLVGPNVFTFRTESDILDRAGVELIIFEPGATNIPANVLDNLPGFEPGRDKTIVVAHGTAGAAEPGQPVALVNESTGETSTVLSKADGSFYAFIRGEESDYISAVIENANKTRLYLPVSKQRFDNGFVGLFQQGGILEAQSDDVTVEVQVEPGAIETRQKIRVLPVTLQQVLPLLNNAQPQEGRLIGAVEYAEEGEGLKSAADISFSVKVADLGVPAGKDPEKASYALTIPRKFNDTVVYEIIDTMSFVPTAPGEGKLVTRSPPYIGLLLRKLRAAEQNTERFDALSNVSLASTSEPGSQNNNSQTTLLGFVSLEGLEATTIAGKVISSEVDDNGAPVGQPKPVAGAIVSVDFGILGNLPIGNFREGELIATSDRDGRFAFALKPLESAAARVLQAVHPRFPFKKALSPGVLPTTFGAKAVNVELVFAVPRVQTVDLAGITPPTLDAAHSPLFPPVGLGANTGARLLVSAVDDRSVTRIDATVTKVQELLGEREFPPSTVSVEEVRQDTAVAGRMFKEFSVKAPNSARVTLEVIASDGEGRTAALPYVIPFGGTAPPIEPGDTNDVRGPRVVLAWPPEGAENVPPLTPILVRFNEPVAASFFNQTAFDWISMHPNHNVRSVQRTKDPREIYIYYTGETEGEVNLSIGPPLTDQNGLVFDQKTIEGGNNPFHLKFKQATLNQGSLQEIGSGGGVVFQGAYAYALERQPGAGGRLIAYDLSDADEFPNPPIKDRLDLEGFPTDLTLISDYSLATDVEFSSGTPTDWNCQRADFLAVFTGSANEPKRLTLVPADGDLPGFVTSFFSRPVSAVLSFSDASMVIKSKWDAPFLGYLESGADVTSISLLSLNAFHTASVASSAERESLPEQPFFGVDKNSDGDFCDSEDVPPLSANTQGQVFGLMFSYAPEDPLERIVDFDFNSAFGIVGTIFKKPDSGQTGFRTVLAGTGGTVLPNAVVNFPAGEEPRRLLFLPAQVVETASGDEVRDLALVSFMGSPGWVGVVDISTPATPVLKMRIDLPQGEGSANTIQRRADGFLVVASTENAILLDPRKVLLPVANQLTHPAIVGRIDGIGGGVRSYVADASGINIINSGTTHRIVQTEPQFEVVTLGTNVSLAAAEAIAEMAPDLKRSYVEASRPISIAQVANISFTNSPPPPDRLNHYYILIRAPGGAGEELDLAMVATSARGGRAQSALKKPLPGLLADSTSSAAYLVSELAKYYKKVASVVDIGSAAGDLAENAADLKKKIEAILTIGEETPGLLADQGDLYLKVKDWIVNNEEFPTTLTAYRLGTDEDKASDLYNTYIAGPVVLLDRPLTPAQIGQLNDQLDRQYLRATPSFWVGLRPGNFALNPFSSVSPFIAPFTSKLMAEREEIIFELPSPEEFAVNILITHMTGARSALVDPLTEYIAQDIDPVLLPGAHVRKPVAISSRPAVFVPGVMGSELVDGRNPSDGGDVNYWVTGQFFNLLSSSSTPLDMNPDGTSMIQNIEPSDVTRAILTEKIYEPFLSFLVNDLGYVEYDFKKGVVFPENGGIENVARHPGLWHRTRLTHGPNAIPNLTQDPIPTLFVFPYDWRQDNAVTAAKLREFMDLVFEIHPEVDKIDLIAHSMGSLVSRRFILENPQLVERFITVGAPWMGSAKMLTAGVLGDMDEAALNIVVPRPTVRRILKFMPAPHQLMPSKGLYDLGLNPVFEAGWDANENGIFYENYNYSDYANVVRNFLFKDVFKEFTGVNLPTNSPAIENHERFHFFQNGAVSDWRNDTLPIEYYHFIGMQSVPQTPGRLALSTKLIPIEPRDNDLSLNAPPIEYFESDDSTGNERPPGARLTGVLPIGRQQFKLIKTLEPIKTSGDGTVPILSLSRGAGSQNDRNAPRAKIFPLVSTSTETDNLANHNGEFQNTRLQEMVAEILQGRTPDAVSVTIAGQFTESFEGQETTLNVAFSRPPSAAGGVTVVWDFGDGGSLIQDVGDLPNSNVQHVYLDDGIYTVSCAVTYGNGVAGFSSRTLVVQNSAPQVEIENGDIEVPAGASPVLVARAVDPGVQDRHIFHWDFNNDGTTDFDGSFVAVPTFSAPGDYTVKVVAEDFSGGVAEDTIVVRVGQGQSTPPAPELTPPSFTLPAGGPKQIEVFISGHKFGTSDGVRIFNDSDLVRYAFEVPLTGLNVTRGLASALAEDASKESVLVNVFRDTTPDGSPVSRTKFVVEGSGQILSVRLRYLEGGIPQKHFGWEVPGPDGTQFNITFNWDNESPEGSIPPKFVLEGISSADRNGPAVAVVENPRTDRMFIIGRDNFTPESQLTFFIGEDSDGDGQFYGETFYELTNRNYLEIAIPSRPYLVLARDAAGNLSDPVVTRPVVSPDADFSHLVATLPPPPPEKTHCEILTDIRQMVRSTIADTLNSDPIKRFLIEEDDIWFFEQGSGACLWRGSPNESCDTCEGVYKPLKSDNDYELFMPVHKRRALTRQEFVGTDPHSLDNMEGDWYFRTPEGLDAGGSVVPIFNESGTINSAIISWRYTLPFGFSNQLGSTVLDISRPASPDDPNSPFFNPISPAQAIAFFFTRALTNQPTFKDLFAEITFFPFRREHFQFAIMSLEKPPAFGDDPIGDAGMGRHLLLLKWLLEGAYVTFPDNTELNDNTVSVNDIFNTLVSDRRIPAADGYEWGAYQDFAALQAGGRVHIERVDSAEGPIAAQSRAAITDDIRKRTETILKKVGKAGIRATLARLAGDTNLQAHFLSITPQQYAAQKIPSFEHFIARVGTTGAGAQIFTGQSSLINNFLRAKIADKSLFDELIANQRVDEFIQEAFIFMRSTVQEGTKNNYAQYLRELESNQRFSELAARKRNLIELEEGFTAGNRPIPGRRKLMGFDNGVEQSIELNLQVANNGPNSATDVKITASESSGPAPLSASSADAATIVNVRGSLTAFDNGDDDPTESDDAFERNLTTVIGTIPPNSSSPILMGESDPPTGVFLIENTAHTRVRNLQLDVAGNASGDQLSPKNNVLRLKVELLPNAAAASSPPDDTVSIELFARTRTRGNVTLTDHAAFGARQRSAKYRLSRPDRILVQVTGKQSASYTLKVASQFDPVGITVDLVRVVGNRFALRTSDHHIALGTASQSPQVGQATIAVRDEEILTFTLLEEGATPVATRTVMVDRAEFSAGGLQFANRVPSDQPRALASILFHGEDLDDLHYFDSGSGTFVDSIGVPGPGNPHPLLPYAGAFGGNLPHSGEADVLFLCAHGHSDGTLLDHDVTLDVGVNPILNPGPDLAVSARWNTDADLAIIYACAALNPEEPLFPGDVSGRTNWTDVMKSSARPVRIILGFRDPVGAAFSELREFASLLNDNTPFVDAWSRSMNRNDNGLTPRPLAGLFFESARDDRAYELGPRPLSGELIRYFDVLNPAEPDCPFGAPGPASTHDLSSPQALPPRLQKTYRFTPKPVLRRSLLNLRYSTRGSAEFLAAEGVGFSPAATSTSASEAVAIAAAHLAALLPEDSGELRHTFSAARRVNSPAPGDPMNMVTNGFVVYFDHYWQGVRIDHDGFSVELTGTNITRISGTFHQPEVDSEVEVGDVLPVSGAMNASDLQQADSASSVPGELVNEARLTFVRLSRFQQAPADRFVPAWVFKTTANLPRNQKSHRVQKSWIHAITGATLGNTTEEP